MRKLKELATVLVLSFMVLEIFGLIAPFPNYYMALAEYRHPTLDLTGRGRCRIENSLPVERGWLYAGITQKGLHIRGLTEDMQVVEKTCPECEFQEISRIYRVDREKVYLVYPEEKELKCLMFTPSYMLRKDEVNDPYQACLRKIHFRRWRITLPKTLKEDSAMWKTVSVQTYHSKRVISHQEAKALTEELFGAFLALNNLHFEEQVGKARKILQDARTWEGRDFKVRLSQEFLWDMHRDTFKAELMGKFRYSDGKTYAQRIQVVKNGLTQVAYSYHCTCPDHSHRGSSRPCKHVLAHVLVFLSFSL